MLELNQAKFSSNGNCGYTLKPKCMWKGERSPGTDLLWAVLGVKTDRCVLVVRFLQPHV